ncbi:hypothetical protein [Paracoccus sulfuroxidans]|uniref:Uncharacterized protein n=1 Tax=Paracoccus sulfuroxidans TaxID=384678 RepID=A0A562NQI0_9RHOB|nr:hypothetical protein [Paracoccus sulfuroxidans]AZV00359.1 hypothetical protein psul1_p51 [Paracoccus phage vB_PsuS_Psul1]TWI34291.1 hypothetical protein IQ24_01806 [Paracoccus sulfuroxidans]
MNPTDKNTHIDDPKVPKLGEEASKEAVPSDKEQQPEKRDKAAEQRIKDLRRW